MKKTISVFLCVCLLLSACITGVSAASINTYYIDSTSGSDDNSGTSPSSAWKTVENLRGISLSSGDSVLFRSGCIFTVEELEFSCCKGTADSPVKISSYGDGDMPLLTTEKYADILMITDCSYLTVSGLELTAPNGGGIWINTKNEKSEGLTLENLKIHNIQNFEKSARDDITQDAKHARACVMIKNIYSHSPYPVDDLTITGCEFYDCGNGVSLWGGWNENMNPLDDTLSLDDLEFYYNHNDLIENCYFHDMDAEALIVGICEDSLVTDCRAIDCVQNDGIDENGNMTHVNAAMWFWGSQHCTIQNCEIAGQKCVGDGMALDFDSRSNYCTYQYIYSHDNMRFIRCCAPPCGQTDNTVRYCLSVNDNGGQNRLGTERSVETNLRFYNNTIINSQSFVIDGVTNGYIANNIFVGDFTKNFSPYQNKKMTDGTVKSYRFTGTFTNNCIYGMAVPTFAKNTYCCSPRFSGNDESDPASYRLSENSPLIGTGVNTGESGTDIFGTDFSDCSNIGCYMGTGTEDEAPFTFGNISSPILQVFGCIYQIFFEIITKIFAF